MAHTQHTKYWYDHFHLFHILTYYSQFGRYLFYQQVDNQELNQLSQIIVGLIR